MAVQALSQSPALGEQALAVSGACGELFPRERGLAVVSVLSCPLRVSQMSRLWKLVFPAEGGLRWLGHGCIGRHGSSCRVSGLSREQNQDVTHPDSCQAPPAVQGDFLFWWFVFRS